MALVDELKKQGAIHEDLSSPLGEREQALEEMSEVFVRNMNDVGVLECMVFLVVDKPDEGSSIMAFGTAPRRFLHDIFVTVYKKMTRIERANALLELIKGD